MIRRNLSILLLFGTLIAGTWATAGVAAQEVSEDVPIDFIADELNVDQNLGIVTARGSVQVTHEQRILRADTISYNQNADVMTATGNVTLLEPGGEVVFADYMEITGDMKNGIVSDIRVILSDNARIAANGGRRIDGDLDMRKAVYSPCNLCPDEPEAAPLWQIKAVNIFHDKSRRMVEYSDAWLEVGGVPVVYTPYFAHPDPTVKRDSGFLTPSFGSSNDLGFFVKTPYFVNINDHSDATITPVYYGDSGPALEAEYRQRFHTGTVDVFGSIVEDDDEDVRGHLTGEGQFLIDDTWRWGFDGTVVSDDTYLRRYRFPRPRQTITSQLYTEGFRHRNYARVEALHFRGLQRTDDSENTPLALPIAAFHHEGTPDRYGGQFLLEGSLASLTRDDGTDSHRISIHPGWRNTYAAPSGELYTFSLNLAGDAYFVNDHTPQGSRPDDEEFTGRLFPQAKLDWRFPLVRQHDQVHQIIEPMVSVVVAPNGSNPAEIPNEDSIEVEFDEGSLFRSNRFAGYDRVESGSRVDYGVKWGVYGDGGGYSSIFVGQSARLRKNEEFADGSGLEDHLSDYVAKVEIRPSNFFSLRYRTRIDNEDLNFERNELDLQAGVPLLNLSTSYQQIDSQADSEFGGREQISTTISSQFSPNWRGSTSALYDFSESRTRRIGMSIIYEDECLVFGGTFQRSFFRDRDLQPNDSFLIRVTLKTLGAFETNAF